jgi:hypothetical protein
VAPGNPELRETAMLSQIEGPNSRDSRLMRTILIVAAAFGITATLLWWIMHP